MPEVSGFWNGFSFLNCPFPLQVLLKCYKNILVAFSKLSPPPHPSRSALICGVPALWCSSRPLPLAFWRNLLVGVYEEEGELQRNGIPWSHL